MKKIILLFLALMPFIAMATNYTSVSGGGNWSNSATWSPMGVPGSGDNVTIASAVTLNANESCNNITINLSQTFTVSGSNSLSVYGNFLNNGTFTYSTGTVSFVGSSAQTLGGGMSGITFYNLTVNSTSTTTLGQAITINNNLDIAAGTLDFEQYQSTGNATGTLTVAAGATIIFGSTSSSTNVAVPTGYTAAHISLSSTSTVVFQANTSSQIIPTQVTYGNLTVSGGSITVVKAPSGIPALTVDGNLLVNVVELNETTKTLNVMGNVTNDGAISFSTGSFNIGGNFTNSGTYTYGTGTLTFNGSANQQLNGSTTPTLYNLTIDQASSTDSVFFNAPITVNNTLTSTQGMLDCQKNQLTNSGTPTVSVSPSAPSVCPGSSVSLTASNYTNYIWFPASSLSPTTGATVVATPTAATTYTVYGINSHTYTCGVGTDVVSLYTPPSVSASASSSTICATIPDTLKCTASSGTSPYTYLWKSTAYSDITCPTCQNTTAYPFGSTYSITVTDAHGCTATNTVSVTVYPPPFITVTGPFSPVCSGTNDTLKVTGASTYVWSTGATTSSIIVAPTSTTTYTVMGTSSLGCKDSAQYVVSPDCSGNGNSSSTAVPVTTAVTCNPVSYSTMDSVMWFSFSAADSNNQIVAISNIIGVSAPHVHRLTLYNSSLQKIVDEYMPEIQGANEIRIDAARLTPGNTYYVRAARTPADSNIPGNNPTPNPVGVDNASLRWSFEMCFRSFQVFIPKDSGSENPSVTQLYYEGRGQIHDVNNIPRFDIKAYSNSINPAIYCSDSLVSLVISHYDTVNLLNDSIKEKYPINTFTDTLQRIDMIPTGASALTLQRVFKMEEDSNAGYLNYFKGYAPNGVTKVCGYSRVVYKNIYSNIDMHVYSNTAGTKFYFVSNPAGGGNPAGAPANIELKFTGATSINILPDSGLSIVTELGDMNFAPGFAYEDSAGIVVAKSWKANFEKVSSNVVKFHIGSYNTNEPLVIEVDQGHKPSSTTGTITWSTFVGADDQFNAVFTGGTSNVYTTGYAVATNFPTTTGVVQETYDNDYDVVIAVFSQLTKTLNWATYYGGKNEDEATTIGLDDYDDVVVAGFTYSTDFPFPTKNGGANAYVDEALNGTGTYTSNTGDAFILELNNTGTQARWATLYGGASSEQANGLVCGQTSTGQGIVYVVGGYQSYVTAPDIPLMVESGTAYSNGIGAGWILKFVCDPSYSAPDLGKRLWATDIGGAPNTQSLTTLTGCTLNQTGLCVTGFATEAGYPVTSWDAGRSDAGRKDAVISQFDVNDNLDWSTYYGGGDDDYGYAITSDKYSDIYITGQTYSPGYSSVSIPVLSTGYGGYYQPTNAAPTPGYNSFIAEFNSFGTLEWGTYFGGSSGSVGYGICLDQASSQNLFVVGQDFGSLPMPSTNASGAYIQTTGPGNAYIAGFNTQNNLGPEYIWGTYYGGGATDQDQAYGVDVNINYQNDIYVVGTGRSNSFPTYTFSSGGFFQKTLDGGSYAAFIGDFADNPVVVAGVDNIIDTTGGILLYPNPASQNITLQIKILTQSDVLINLYNILGQSVYSANLKNQLGAVTRKIDVTSLVSGPYLVRVTVGNNNYIKKFVKEN